VGLTLIFGVLDVINVAHGEFFAVGGYLVFAAVVLLHLPAAAGVVVAGLGAFALGLAVYPLLIAPLKRRLGRRPAGSLYLVLTLGLSTFMQSSLLAVAGGDYRRVPPLARGILEMGFTGVSYQRLLVVAVAADSSASSPGTDRASPCARWRRTRTPLRRWGSTSTGSSRSPWRSAWRSPESEAR
jgi:branched-chain amino acid transport system permease protein